MRDSCCPKQFVVYREIMLLTAILAGSAGVTLMARSGFGISVASSVPYVFSLHFTQISFGMWSFISFFIAILLTVFITHHYEKVYLVTLLIAFIYGLSNDLFKFIWSFLPDSGLVFQVVFFLAGWLFLSTGIACFIKSELPPAPYELFMREVSHYKKVSIARVKTIYDLSSLLISVLFILFILKKPAGIGPGTIVVAIFNGTVIGFWIKLMNRHFQLKSLIVLPD